MSISTNYSYRPVGENVYGDKPFNQTITPRIGGSARGGLLKTPIEKSVDWYNQIGGSTESMEQVQARMNKGQMGPIAPQAYKDQSADTRTGLQSFFSAGARYREKDAV